MLKRIIWLMAFVDLGSGFGGWTGPWLYSKVIEFQSDDSNPYAALGEKPETLDRTKNFTLCFRFMTRFFHRHKLFQSKQWYLQLKNDMEFSGYLNFRPVNTSLADGFSKMFLLKPISILICLCWRLVASKGIFCVLDDS